MLTERAVVWLADRVIGDLRESDEAEEPAERYGFPPLAAATVARFREATLMGVHGILAVALTLALAGAIASWLGVYGGVFVWVGVAALAFCGVGTCIHLVRFYDAQIAMWRSREDVEWRWPRASSDLDFLVQGVGGAIVASVVV